MSWLLAVGHLRATRLTAGRELLTASMKPFTTEQMRAFDRAASGKFSIPSIVLMENAALRVVEFLETQFAPLAGKRIVILCGKGNNGGAEAAFASHGLPGNAGCEVRAGKRCGMAHIL